MLIYICGFTRGGCQIMLDKAWKCFCIYGTLDLLKGTTKQITDDWFLPPCAKIYLRVWFQPVSLPLQARSTSVLQTSRVREKLCSEVREEEGGKWSSKYILMGHNCICACLLSCLCIDLRPSLCLSLFLRWTRQWFITVMQGYLTLHLYGIVCPSGSKAFTAFMGSVFSRYSSVMLTPSENLILSQFPFCLPILIWHTVILQMQNRSPPNPATARFAHGWLL